jgi:hypothetical protein
MVSSNGYMKAHRYISWILFMLLGNTSLAQVINISGMASDSTDHSILIGANIILQQAKDTTQ